MVSVLAAYHAQLERLLRPLPESCVLIVLGLVVGLLLYLADTDRSHQLDSRTFFFLLLPPIIIDAGHFMPTRAFFDQLGTIVLYALIGTMVRHVNSLPQFTTVLSSVLNSWDVSCPAGRA